MSSAIRPLLGKFTDRSGTITSGGTAQTVMPVNNHRAYLVIENVSAGDLWVNFTTPAVQNQPSLKISPNGSYVLESSFVTDELVSIIGATTGQAFTAKEA